MFFGSVGNCLQSRWARQKTRVGVADVNQVAGIRYRLMRDKDGRRCGFVAGRREWYAAISIEGGKRLTVSESRVGCKGQGQRS